MTARKKRGVGFLISGGAFIVGSVLCFTTMVDPGWFPIALAIVGMLANFFSFKTVFPDTK